MATETQPTETQPTETQPTEIKPTKEEQANGVESKDETGKELEKEDPEAPEGWRQCYSLNSSVNLFTQAFLFLSRL
jgi:hypothetical protein